MITPLARHALLFVALTCPLTGCTQAPADSVPATATLALLREQVTSGTLPGARWSSIKDVAAEVSAAYDRVQWQPLWSNGGRPTPAALATVAWLSRADSLGLDPADFDAGRLDSLGRVLTGDPSAEQVTAFEGTLSVASARMLAALRWGRVRQPRAYPRAKATREGYDLAGGLLALSLSPDPTRVIAEASPQWAPYRALTEALPELRRMADDAAVSAQAPVAPVRGQLLSTAPRLRSLLASLGVAPDSAALLPSPAADTVLDATLSASVRRFQSDVGLPRTGLFDARTRDSLQATLKRRERSAVLSLERWRWLPRAAPDHRAIVVNIPEYRLHAYDDAASGDPSFSMNVVVGRDAKDRYTPLFAEEMEHVIFSPYWEVPQTIARDEIVPKATRDSTYLARNRYVLVRGSSSSAPTLTPDSTTLGRIGTSVRVRQLPGDYNSLGRVKFMLPNDMNIYLHDTNEKHLFKRATRALSHGCVRVSQPQRLAEWVLAGDTAWTVERMKLAMKAEKPELVRLSAHIPVLLVYHTASVESNGVTRVFKDVYAYDSELETLLARGYGTS